MAISRTQIYSLLVTVLVMGLNLNISFGHEGHAFRSCVSEVHEEVNVHHHQCDHAHDHLHHHHQHHHHHGHENGAAGLKKKLPEELAEEEDLKMYGSGSHDDHDHVDGLGASELTGIDLWVHAMGCSLLVSLASLICLIILPLFLIQGKPSKTVVDSLAVFGAGAMLGDAFLHQLPHAFGGEHSHSLDHQGDHGHHQAQFGHQHSHSHSLKDLSVGLSILAGIVLFLLVEKLVRYVEDMSRGVNAWSHGHHHHHHHKNSKKLKDDIDGHENLQGLSTNGKNGRILETSSVGKILDSAAEHSLNGEKKSEPADLRKRNTNTSARENQPDIDAPSGSTDIKSIQKEPARTTSNLVFGYLNLFSDGVHNFTDGMALGNAFLLYGSVGGWSRTIFLLAHELPQEIGDFGILVRSGFSVSKALLFNFLSALVALAGTALALVLGQDPGQSSLIEGFTAGGFMYIALAGVLAEMNSGSLALRNMAIQLTALVLGMSVALCISLVE